MLWNERRNGGVSLLWRFNLLLCLCVGGLGCQPTENVVIQTVAEVIRIQEESKPELPLTYEQKRQTWLKIAPIIKAYHDKQDDLIWECLETFCKRMDGYKPRASKFAGEAMSLSTKWEFAKSKLSELFTTDPLAPYQFESYVHELFEKEVISPKDIQREVECCLTEYVERYNALNNDMLVKIQAALNEEGYSKMPEYAVVANTESFQKAFLKSFNQVTASVAQDTTLDLIRLTVVQEIGSALATRLATSIATRFGVSEVILGTGAVSGVTTLGVSLVGGWALDWLVGEFLKAFADYDPERDIRDKVITSLDRLTGQLQGYCSAGVCAAFYQHMIEDLYGVPGYPEQDVKSVLIANKMDLEKNYDMGITFQLVSYKLARKKAIDKALAQLIFGQDAEASCIGRYWLPQNRPHPKAIFDYLDKNAAELKKGGRQ